MIKRGAEKVALNMKVCLKEQLGKLFTLVTIVFKTTGCFSAKPENKVMVTALMYLIHVCQFSMEVN